jgi:prepilin-type N-terminal cleavage/methylation domain-containing protein
MVMVVCTTQARIRRNRSGFTLLEVLIALAILLIALAALSRLLTMGGNFARDANQQTECVRLAQSKLNEVWAGVVPLQSQGDTPFDENPDYLWSLDAENDPNVTNLWDITVTVSRPQAGGGKMTVTLSHMLIDPSIRGSMINSSGTTGGSSGGTTGS